MTPSLAVSLPNRQLLAYGALGLPLAMAALPVYVHVPRLYAESAGMSLSLLGSLLLAARLLDAGSLGIIYPSVRRAGGTNLACFRPALVGNPRRAASFRLTWAGGRQPQVERL